MPPDAAPNHLPVPTIEDEYPRDPTSTADNEQVHPNRRRETHQSSRESNTVSKLITQSHSLGQSHDSYNGVKTTIT
jgi:hypothetical protein